MPTDERAFTRRAEGLAVDPALGLRLDLHLQLGRQPLRRRQPSRSQRLPGPPHLRDDRGRYRRRATGVERRLGCVLDVLAVWSNRRRFGIGQLRDTSWARCQRTIARSGTAGEATRWKRRWANAHQRPTPGAATSGDPRNAGHRDRMRRQARWSRTTSAGARVAGRYAAPDDIAATVAFLASPAARHLTGTIVTVDGGLLA